VSTKWRVCCPRAAGGILESLVVLTTALWFARLVLCLALPPRLSAWTTVPVTQPNSAVLAGIRNEAAFATIKIARRYPSV
jgi:hypothetical protein